MRLLTVSTASAAFIRSGGRGRDRESLSEQTEAFRDGVRASQRGTVKKEQRSSMAAFICNC